MWISYHFRYCTFKSPPSLTSNFLLFFRSWCVLFGVTLGKLWGMNINKSIRFSYIILRTVLRSQAARKKGATHGSTLALSNVKCSH